MIRYFDYRPEYSSLKKPIQEAINRVLDSGQLILGSEVEQFEKEMAASLGLQGAVGTNSGTDALIIALRALEVGQGDEVITVANAGVPTVAAIRAVGAEPRFVDVHPETLQMDPGCLDGAMTPRTRCVVPVHLYGQPADLEEVVGFARRYDLSVVEDCAQAQGATYNNRPAGSIGDIGCFSFYPTKILGAFGDGGLCATDDPRLLSRLKMLRMYGFRDDRHAHREGLNSRLDEIQAAILRVKLGEIDWLLRQRREIAGRYHAGLEGADLNIPSVTPGGTHVYHLFVIMAPDRERFTGILAENGIGYGIHYPEPVHLMEAYGFLGYRKGDLPVTEEACRQVLSLPMYTGLQPEAVDRITDLLRSA